MSATVKAPLVVIRRRQVEAKTGISKTTIYAGIAAGTFPAPIQLTGGNYAVGWLEHEIDAWIAGRVAARDKNPG
ncbi:MAG: AlpA family transcriptional regulator [Azonexus sp.]|nr:AlpA family transcriptional regulator [Azonexus sp.]MCK6413883.1 AlpA family transcriptional regulator [Azonexus sp.]